MKPSDHLPRSAIARAGLLVPDVTTQLAVIEAAARRRYDASNGSLA